MVLVDDDPLVRSGLRAVLAAADDIEVVGEAADGYAALDEVALRRPAVVLMDLRMHGMGGIDATSALREKPEPPEVVVLTAFDTDDAVLDALRTGASGFVLKDSPPTQIIDAVRAAAHGDALLSPAVTRSVLAHIADPAGRRRRKAAKAALDQLTDREREVALAVADGGSNAEIGATLHLAEATVKAYLSRAMHKLGVTSRVQIALLVRDADD